VSRLWLRVLVGVLAVAATFAVAIGALVVGPLRSAAAAGAPAQAVVAPVERGLVLAGASAVVATAGWALWAGLVGARELRLVRRAVSRMAGGDLAPAGRAPAAPEVEALRLRLAAEARDQAEAIGVVAHDLRSPLAGILLAVERAGRAGTDAERERALAVARRECGRAAGLADEVLCRCRDVGAGERLETLGRVLEDVAGRLRDVDVRVEPDAARLVCADAPVARAVANLAENAVRHASRADGVRIRAARRDGGLEIAVEDDGPGFDPGAVAAFARRGPAPGAAGLGLVSALRAVQAAGGEIRLERRDGGGMRAVVRVPEAA
jgi:signal transduction histidine kinase